MISSKSSSYFVTGSPLPLAASRRDSAMVLIRFNSVRLLDLQTGTERTYGLRTKEQAIRRVANDMQPLPSP